MSAHNSSHQIYWQRCKTTLWMKTKQPLCQMVLRKLDGHIWEKELDAYSSPFKKNTKWNKDINVKPEKQKVLEENRYLQKDICKGKDFSVKKLHFKRDLITLKRFCTAKGTTNENEAHIEDNICQSYMWWHTFWK